MSYLWTVGKKSATLRLTGSAAAIFSWLIMAELQSSKGRVPRVMFFTTRNLSVIVSGAVFMTALIKADKTDIPKIVEMLVSSGHVAFIGWAFAVVILAGSVWLMKMSTKIHDREIERLVKERDLLQKRLLTPGEE
jgi:hypothetical protein